MRAVLAIGLAASVRGCGSPPPPPEPLEEPSWPSLTQEQVSWLGDAADAAYERGLHAVIDPTGTVPGPRTVEELTAADPRRGFVVLQTTTETVRWEEAVWR